MTDPDDLVADLRAHLAATAERPVERHASRWIGEAEAVIEDVAGGEVDDDVLRMRADQAGDLLDEVDGTGDPEADRHVEQARALTERILEEL